jgi:integrase
MALVRHPSFGQAVLDADWLPSLAEQAQKYVDASKSENTRRAYRADWADFTGWCRVKLLDWLPADPASLILYLTELSGKAKVATLTRRLSAISQAHQLAGHASPTQDARVRTVMAGIRRTKGTAPETKRPVLVAELKTILENLPGSLLGTRDRALLLLGFSGGFRRSELVALDVEHLIENRDGMVVTLGRSKTDQEGQGRRVGIPRGREEATCPVRALELWRAAGHIETGALFRVMNRHGQVLPKRLSGEGVALVVKRWVEPLGYDPATFAAHSLRAGLATSAAAAGKSERAIMQQTGHRSVAMVRRYIREGNLFRENAAEGLGL